MNKAPVNEIGAQNDGLACSQTPELKFVWKTVAKGHCGYGNVTGSGS